jgi:hypothetical protein
MDLVIGDYCRIVNQAGYRSTCLYRVLKIDQKNKQYFLEAVSRVDGELSLGWVDSVKTKKEV